VANHNRRIPIPGFDADGIGKLMSTVSPVTMATTLGYKTGICTTGNSLDWAKRDNEMMKENDAAFGFFLVLYIIYMFNTIAAIAIMVIITDTDATMGHFAVNDQYCDLETGYWHKMIFPNTSATCDVPWYHRWRAPLNLTFTPDKWVGGYMLDYCKKGKCPNDDSYGDEEHCSLELKGIKDTIPIIQDGAVVGTMKEV
jgi:hypothetical protein